MFDQAIPFLQAGIEGHKFLPIQADSAGSPAIRPIVNFHTILVIEDIDILGGLLLNLRHGSTPRFLPSPALNQGNYREEPYDDEDTVKNIHKVPPSGYWGFNGRAEARISCCLPRRREPTCFRLPGAPPCQKAALLILSFLCFRYKFPSPFS